jgi:hypothetical protein
MARLPLPLALAIAAGLYGAWLTAPPGPGLEPDSMSYLGAAESLVRHGTLRVPWAHWADPDSTSPLQDFPPGFSIAIALPRAAGLPPAQAARVVMVLGLAVAVGAIGAAVRRAAGPAAAILAAALVLATPGVVGAETIVLSEPLYLALLALTLHRMVATPDRPWRYGLLAGVGALIRYAGVALIGAAGIWAFAHGGGGGRLARLRRAAWALLPGAALQALWVIRTDSEGGNAPHTSFDWYGGLWDTVRRGLGTTVRWLAPTLHGGAGRDAVALLLGLLALALVARAARSAAPSRPLLAAVTLLAACSVAVLVYARVMVGEAIEFDARILTPLFVLAAVAVAASLGVRWGPWSARARAAAALPLVLWMGLAIPADAAAVRVVREGYGYEAPEWQESAFARRLRDATTSQFFTNDPAAVYFLTGRPARLLVAALDSGSVRAFADTLQARRGVLLRFEADFEDVAPADSLAARLGWREAIRFEHGTAWLPPNR